MYVYLYIYIYTNILFLYNIIFVYSIITYYNIYDIVCFRLYHIVLCDIILYYMVLYCIEVHYTGLNRYQIGALIDCFWSTARGGPAP